MTKCPLFFLSGAEEVFSLLSGPFLMQVKREGTPFPAFAGLLFLGQP